MESIRIGLDESGKGDFFGPLVLVACWLPPEQAERFPELAAKRLSANACLAVEPKLRKACRCTVLTIGPDQYNALYDKVESANRVLAWGHAQTLSGLLPKVEARTALGTELGDQAAIHHLLAQKGLAVELETGPAASSNASCKAAGVLARAAYLRSLAKLGELAGVPLPRGANQNVLQTAARILAEGGSSALAPFAKLHFRTAREAARLARSGRVGAPG